MICLGFSYHFYLNSLAEMAIRRVIYLSNHRNMFSLSILHFILFIRDLVPPLFHFIGLSF